MPSNLPDYIRQTPQGTVLNVRVQPRASRTAIAGPMGDALKIAVKSPPVDGAANAELCSFLAKQLKLAKSAVEIVGGRSGRSKTVLLHGVRPDQAVAHLRS